MSYLDSLSRGMRGAPVKRSSFGEAVESALGTVQRYGISHVTRRGTRELLDSYNNTPIIRSVVHRIASSAASVPWEVVRPAKQNAKGVAAIVRDVRMCPDAHQRSAIVRRGVEEGSLITVTDHPVYRLIDDPTGPKQAISGHQFRQTLVTWLDLVGEAPSVIERTKGGDAGELWPIPPHWIHARPGQNGSKVWDIGGIVGRKVPAEDMLVLRDVNPLDPYGGSSGFAEAASYEIDADHQAAIATAARFANGGAPDYILSLPGAKDSEVQRVEGGLNNRFKGTTAAGNSIWGTNAEPKVTPLGQSFADLQLVELRKFEREILHQTWGMPPELIGILESSNRSTIDAASYIFAKWLLLPRLELLRDGFMTAFASMLGEDILVFESPVPEDEARQIDMVLKQPWIVSINESRKVAGYGPIEGGDVHMVEPNLVPQDLGEVKPDESVGDEGQEEDKRVVLSFSPAPVTKIVDDAIQAIIDAMDVELLTDPTHALWSEKVHDFIMRAAKNLGVNLSFEQISRAAKAHLDEFAADRVVGINATTEKAIRATLTEGFAAGEDVRKLAKRVRKVFDEATTWRSENIARTECVRSSNFGNWTGQKLSGVVDEREWVATPDMRTRHAHRILDRQTVGIDEAFKVPSGEWAGETAMFPGGFAEAALSCNCRCTTAPVVEGVQMSADERLAVWKTYDRHLSEWEKAAEIAFSSGFEAQEKAVLKALKRAVSEAA